MTKKDDQRGQREETIKAATTVYGMEAMRRGSMTGLMSHPIKQIITDIFDYHMFLDTRRAIMVQYIWEYCESLV